MAHIALAWMRYKKQVVAPVIGATKLPHLESAVDSLAVELTAEDVAYLEGDQCASPACWLNTVWWSIIKCAEIIFIGLTHAVAGCQPK